jgi:hypothetical protein
MILPFVLRTQPQPLVMFTRKQFLGLAFLFTAVGCGHSHSDDQDVASTPAHDAVTHSHTTESPGEASSLSTLSTLSPFQVKSTIVDGAVTSDGDGLVLVFDLGSAAQPENAPSDEMVWFLNRTETGSTCATTIRAVAVGEGVRAEALVFTEHKLELDSRHNNAGEGFVAIGDLSLQKAGQFDVNITREVEDRLRIHRTMKGTCGAGQLVAHSELQTANWDLKTWGVRHRTRDYLMVGVSEPTSMPSNLAGEWRSVTLNGSVRRLDWTLTPNRWTLASVAGGAEQASLGQGDYTVGPKGQMELVSDAAGDVDRTGYINSKVGGAVVYASPSGGSFSSASYWWKVGADTDKSATPGTWHFVGRRAAVAPETGLVTGTLELASDGGLRGELVNRDTEEAIPFIGQLNPGIPASGKIQFSFSAAPSDSGASSNPAGSPPAAPHSH